MVYFYTVKEVLNALQISFIYCSNPQSNVHNIRFQIRNIPQSQSVMLPDQQFQQGRKVFDFGMLVSELQWSRFLKARSFGVSIDVRQWVLKLPKISRKQILCFYPVFTVDAAYWRAWRKQITLYKAQQTCLKCCMWMLTALSSLHIFSGTAK